MRDKLTTLAIFMLPVLVIAFILQQMWLYRDILAECTAKHTSPFEQRACIEVQQKVRWF